LIYKVAECRTRPDYDIPPLTWEGNNVRSAEIAEIESSIFVDAHLEKQGIDGIDQLGGTCSSTLFLVDSNGKMHMFERIYD